MDYVHVMCEGAVCPMTVLMLFEDVRVSFFSEAYKFKD